ncbi:MAG: MBL fold metallo-hydrolase [Gemmatimonadota bacterium]
MLLRTIYNDKLAQASYLLACQRTGEAIVIDPTRAAEQYIRLARKEGLRITHVTETHIHADFVSGTRELAQQSGAKLYLSGEGGAEWSYGFAQADGAVLLHDGDVFNVGNIRIQAMHTPGHTPEHLSFVVTDTPVTDQPMGVFTGDFVFVGDVGRPDLLEKAAGLTGTMRDSAHALYRSIQRFRQFADYIQVWPGHGAGSACGKALGAVPQSTVGYEKLFSPAFAFTNEEAFADYILAGQPESPRYFARMKRINRDGPPVLGGLRVPAKLADESIAELRARGVTLVDTRSAPAFGRGHVPGSINIPYNRAFTGWAGALISYDAPFALILDDRTAAHTLADIARDLSFIGLDEIVGYLGESAVENVADQQSLASTGLADLEQLRKHVEVEIVDVRGRGEWAAGHIPGVHNIPLAQLADRMHELPRDRQIVVHCQSGGRAAIGASVLQAAGFDVMSLRGGFAEWTSSGGAVERGAPADTVAQGG